MSDKNLYENSMLASHNEALIEKLKNYKDGVHLGHKSIRLSESNSWHPSMANYHLGIRDGITICNIQQTQKCLSRAFYVCSQILEKGGSILIVNTNPEFYKLSLNWMKFMEQHLPKSTFSSVSYCLYKWIGGTLDNYKQISKSIVCYIKFSQRCLKFCEKYNINPARYQKIKKCFQGYGFLTSRSEASYTQNVALSSHSEESNLTTSLFLNKRRNSLSSHSEEEQQSSIVMSLQRKPDIIFIFNPADNKKLILEANRLHIPIIACTSTRENINGISYPIPCNNTSIEFTYALYKKLYKILQSIDNVR